MAITKKSVVDFVITSSADPEKLSLSVRGILLMYIPFIVQIMKLVGIDGIEEGVLKDVVEAIALFIMYVGYTSGAAMAAFGLIRKVLSQIGGAFDK